MGKPQFVYFISDGDHVKIGVSANPEKRLATLQTASSQKLWIVCKVEGTFEYERQFHERFRAHRVQGEWFLYADEIRAFICAEENWRMGQYGGPTSLDDFELLGDLPRDIE
jgi:Meiotically Up-regulated Gene 113 (MUG113) protein